MPLGQVENLRQRARLTLTAPDPRTHAQTWLKTKKRLARPSSRQPPTKRSPRRTGAATRRAKDSRPPDSRFPSSEASSSPLHLFPQGVPLPQEPQRRQGRRRGQQSGVRPRVQLHARLPRGLSQPSVDVDQEDRGALGREDRKRSLASLERRTRRGAAVRIGQSGSARERIFLRDDVCSAINISSRRAPRAKQTLPPGSRMDVLLIDILLIDVLLIDVLLIDVLLIDVFLIRPIRAVACSPPGRLACSCA